MRLEVTLPDSLFSGAQRLAAASGITMDAFVADAVQLSLQADPEDDMGWFFTPDRVAEIRDAAAEARTGNNLTPEQVDAHFVAKRAKWLENQSR